MTATNWWLPEEAEPERQALLKRVLKVLADRDYALSRIAGDRKPWKWTLKRLAGEAPRP